LSEFHKAKGGNEHSRQSQHQNHALCHQNPL
jgi:hypothetical protein